MRTAGAKLFLRPLRKLLVGLGHGVDFNQKHAESVKELTVHSLWSFSLTQERERRSPPFNHLRMHPFSEGVSALQIYCMKEGVKVCNRRTVLSYAEQV